MLWFILKLILLTTNALDIYRFDIAGDVADGKLEWKDRLKTGTFALNS